MTSLRHILWIEDKVQVDFRHLMAHTTFDGRFRVDVAGDATTAMLMAGQAKYDGLIMDILIPPGNDSHWFECYDLAVFENKPARLGLLVLQAILDSGSRFYLPHVAPSQCAVFTDDSIADIAAPLNRLGVKFVVSKTYDLAADTLTHLCELVTSAA